MMLSARVEEGVLRMASYSMNQLRVGLKIMVDSDPCIIVDTDFVKPGKGQAFVRLKYKNLRTMRVNERTYKSAESLEGADVVDTTMQYLYSDGELWYFMDTETYEQIGADTDTVGNSAQWLKEEDMCELTLWQGVPLVVTPPNFVVLKITDTDPGVKGDTSSGGSKPATLETGALVRVPLFVQVGELIKIDTRTGEYVSRAKE
jgi:elongation factor P